MSGEFQAQLLTATAISWTDYETYGCPLCLVGEKKGIRSISGQGASVFICANCHIGYIICADSIQKSPFAIGEIYPTVTEHPLRDT